MPRHQPLGSWCVLRCGPRPHQLTHYEHSCLCTCQPCPRPLNHPTCTLTPHRELLPSRCIPFPPSCTMLTHQEPLVTPPSLQSTAHHELPLTPSHGRLQTQPTTAHHEQFPGRHATRPLPSTHRFSMPHRQPLRVGLPPLHTRRMLASVPHHILTSPGTRHSTPPPRTISASKPQCL